MQFATNGAGEPHRSSSPYPPRAPRCSSEGVPADAAPLEPDAPGPVIEALDAHSENDAVGDRLRRQQDAVALLDETISDLSQQTRIRAASAAST